MNEVPVITAGSRRVGRRALRFRREQPSPTWTAARMFLRELRRRWLSLLFMLLMPTFYFFVMYATSDPHEISKAKIFTGAAYEVVDVLDRDFKAMYLSTLGISVTSAFAALSMIKGSTAAMRRLRLVGYTAAQLLLARLLVLLAITVASTVVFTLIIVALLSLNHTALVALAMFEIGLLGVALGTLLGLALNREFEASLIIIAICGIQVALGRSGSDAERFLLFRQPVEAIKTAGFTASTNVSSFVTLGLLYALVMFVVAYGIWALRTRVWASYAR